MSVRFTYRADGKGHALVVVDGEDVDGVGRRYVAAHRLAAVAWGVLESFDDPREVHHVDVVPCHNSECNLEALKPEQHARVTNRNARERRG
jgi:hypothetical protein